MSQAHTVRTVDVEGIAAIELVAQQGDARVVVVPELSLLTSSFSVRSRELLHVERGLRPHAAALRLHGIPLLHPWANRLPTHRFAVAGRSVDLDPRDPNLPHDGNGLPIHGLLVAPHAWSVDHLHADDDEASLSASFDFAEIPALLRAFPFPHRVRTTISLSNTVLRFATTLENGRGQAPLPIALGYHPYFTLPRLGRAHWEVEIPQSIRLELDAFHLPTGKGARFVRQLGPLGDQTFDDGFVGLADASRFVVQNTDTRIAVVLDSGYPCAQVYAPANRDIICFEPMTAPTAALSTGDHLRCVAPGSSFTAAWSIHVTLLA